jgi:hypothetical protein
MNAVEIEEAISVLALQPFDAAEFPFAFLAAFGNKDTALKRLRTGNNNDSDVTGGVLQRSKIHIGVCEDGTVGETLKALRASLATAKARAKFILATDGQTLEAEALTGGETIACAYPDFPNHFGFFLPLAGISTIKEISDNPIDVRATGRLNKLYVELLRENPDWANLLHAGNLNWKQINPDIFGSMIQAVADDEERGALGMHYTSVPNILKVLNPLFLDDLRAQLNEASDNERKLLNLRREYPSGTRSAFSRHHRRPIRPGQHAG